MLTHSHHELLSFIEDFVAQHGYSPSQEEMKTAVGLKSRSGVNRMVTCLEERGYVRRLPNRARAIELTRRPAACTEPDPIVSEIVEALRQAIEEYGTSGAIAATEQRHWSVMGKVAIAQFAHQYARAREERYHVR